MYTFPELIKKIRASAGLTQAEFADAIKVSPVLIAMVESGQREVSKQFILKLADALHVHPSSITPFIYAEKDGERIKLSAIEKQLIKIGTKLQGHLVDDRAKLLKKHAK